MPLMEIASRLLKAQIACTILYRCMSRPVFISYARSASAADARALADQLEDLAFLDTEVIEDGDHFPQRLLDGVLDARVVVIFATKSYVERRFCRLEMRLALAGCDAEAKQVVVALGEGANAVLDGLPVAIADQSWPAAGERARLNDLVRQRLHRAAIPLRDRLAEEEAQKLAVAFLEESKTPEPRPLHDVLCSLPQGVAAQSIGARFVGRADDLRRIHRALWEGRGAVAQLTSRITGGGGFGKTRLASEYVHRYGASYYPGGVFWINASSKTLATEFWRVLSAINDRTPDLATLRAQGRNVKRELERALRGIGTPTLYVVDDIPEAGPGENPASIGDFCPALGAVTVLATSRQDSREANVRTIPVDILGREAAILLLTENVPGAGALRWDQWERIAAWVGYLPLFLDLLNRSLALNSISPRELLHRADAIEPLSQTAELDSLREALRGQVPKHAVRGVTEAFFTSFEKLDHAAKKTARILAELAPAPIPEAFVEALPEECKNRGVKAALVSRHFITSGGGPAFGLMHRTLADFLRSISAEMQHESLVVACRALLQTMTPGRCKNPREWPLMNLCRPHAEVLVARGLNIDSITSLSCEIGSVVAILSSAQGDYVGARKLYERVLEASRRELGEEHPETLMSLNSLAETLWRQEDRVAGRLLMERVLEVRKRVLGEEHPDTLMSLNNFAWMVNEQGDHAGARRLQERVLELRRRVLGEEHPHTLVSISNLAGILSAQGDYAGARALVERVLEVRERELGKDHPDTLMSLTNLAWTLSWQGDNSGARALQERVLETRRRMLGEEHPDTLTSMNSLAETLADQGDYTAARQLQERVLEVRRRVLGEEHPATLTSMTNLAGILSAKGDYAGARVLDERALELWRRVLGEEHPYTLTSMNNLAQTLKTQGDYARARQLQERVLEVRRRVLGEEHPATLTSMDNLAETLKTHGDYSAARRLQERVLEASRRILGEEHPDTLTSMDNLAETLKIQGDCSAARRLQERVLEASRRVLGEEHPNTLTSMNNLAETLRTQGDLGAARRLHGRVLEVRRRMLGEEHPDTLVSMWNLALALHDAGEQAEALRMMRNCLDGQRRVLGDQHPHTIGTAEFLTRLKRESESR